MVTVAWGGNQFTPLLVQYRYDGGLSILAVDLLLAAYIVGIVPTMLASAAMVARYGRKSVFFAAPVVSVVGSATMAVGGTNIAVVSVGRVLSGAGIGLAMAVGSQWIKDLSDTSRSATASGVGARRASVSLTVGFLLGAAAAGVLAEWAPFPFVLPFVAHVVVSVPAYLVASRIPDTTVSIATTLAMSEAVVTARRVARVHALTAPWVFGAAGVAYAVLPNIVGDTIPHVRIGFSALATVVTLGTGALVQPLGQRMSERRLDGVRTSAMAVTAAGMAVAAGAASTASWSVALFAAALLGAGFGLNMVGGLIAVQRSSPVPALGVATAVYYSMTYIGFAMPAMLAAIAPVVDSPTSLAIGALLAAVCCLRCRQSVSLQRRDARDRPGVSCRA